MYLPQFHRIPENDMWWGEGFTEWTAVKAGEKFFEGQMQPRVPLDGNYYDLLNEQTMRWQADLMRKYDIYGMCFYHYYFKDGRKILEKPAENLLEWKDIEMPFCFSWANETWARSWSNINGKNAWSSKFDNRIDNKEKDGILLEQQYGGETEWVEHYEYLSQFFKDRRYIKVDNKPVFIIYNAEAIPCLTKMVNCWKREAKRSGFEGIYLIGVNSVDTGCLDAIVRQEPQNTLKKTNREKLVDSNYFWREMLNEKVDIDTKTYFCGFPGYDDTPRRGEGGRALSIISPKEYENNMTKLIAKGRELGNEFTFINAWNEWGEGMYLEPDEVNGYAFLQSTKNALNRSEYEKYGEISYKTENDKVIDRYKSYWRFYDKWITAFEHGKYVSEYLLKQGYMHVAIYGLGMVGRHLVEQLNNSDVTIDFGIDVRGDDERRIFDVYTPEDDLPETQIIIVAVTYGFSEIYTNLRNKVACEVISLDEIIDTIINE